MVLQEQTANMQNIDVLSGKSDGNEIRLSVSMYRVHVAYKVAMIKLGKLL